MAIKLVKMGTSAGIGAVDCLTEYIDEKQLYTKPFQNLTDWGRLAYTVGGYGANYMRVGDDEITESMVVAGIPLLEKSLVKVVKTYVIKGKQGRMGLKLKTEGRKPNPSPGAGNIRWG